MYIRFNWHSHYKTGTGSLFPFVFSRPVFGAGLYWFMSTTLPVIIIRDPSQRLITSDASDITHCHLIHFYYKKKKFIYSWQQSK